MSEYRVGKYERGDALGSGRLEEDDDVIVIGSTNNAGQIDPALRRPGRLGITIEVGPSSAEGREEIFDVHPSGIPLIEDVGLEAIAVQTHSYTGANIGSN